MVNQINNLSLTQSNLPSGESRGGGGGGGPARPPPPPKKIFGIRLSEVRFPALWGSDFLFFQSKSNANKTGQKQLLVL